MGAHVFKTRDIEIKYYLKYLIGSGLSINIFEENQHEMPYDIVWQWFNKTIVELSQNKQWGALSSLYYSIAIICDKIEKQHPKNLLEKSRYFQLVEYKYSPFEKVAIMTSNNGCDQCNALEGKIITINKALELMPLPHSKCTHILENYSGFCRCQYIIALKK